MTDGFINYIAISSSFLYANNVTSDSKKPELNLQPSNMKTTVLLDRGINIAKARSNKVLTDDGATVLFDMVPYSVMPSLIMYL